MKILSKHQCYELMSDMKMMDHIVAHCIMVSRVSLLITDHLKKQGEFLNRNLVQASALLHDITKTKSLKTGENHAVTGEKLLCGKGHTEVGYIIGKHICLDKYTDSGHPSEAEIVNYSDKRVLHDKVVPLEVRIAYIMERYGKTPEFCRRIQKFGEKIKFLEIKLFNRLNFSPEQLGSLLNASDFADDVSDYAIISETFAYKPEQNNNPEGLQILSASCSGNNKSQC